MTCGPKLSVTTYLDIATVTTAYITTPDITDARLTRDVKVQRSTMGHSKSLFSSSKPPALFLCLFLLTVLLICVTVNAFALGKT
uniref:Uncharacterized protein n=1 Tax=Anguilla anguilla TaxID=7936 RepID=A0A0E9QP19_ANGAN